MGVKMSVDISFVEQAEFIQATRGQHAKILGAFCRSIIDIEKAKNLIHGEHKVLPCCGHALETEREEYNYEQQLSIDFDS